MDYRGSALSCVGTTDADPLWLHYDDATVEIVELVSIEQAIDQRDDGCGVLAGGAKNDDTGVGPGRESADVAHATVERDDHPVRIGRCLHDHRVWATAELLVNNGVHVVAPLRERAGQIARKILVELEPHAGSGRTSSRAKAAP